MKFARYTEAGMDSYKRFKDPRFVMVARRCPRHHVLKDAWAITNDDKRGDWYCMSHEDATMHQLAHTDQTLCILNYDTTVGILNHIVNLPQNKDIHCDQPNLFSLIGMLIVSEGFTKDDIIGLIDVTEERGVVISTRQGPRVRVRPALVEDV